MSRIVVAEFLPEAALALLRDAGEVVAGADLHARRADLLEQLADAEALLVRNQTRVDAELLAAAPRLRVIGRVGAGLDNFDLGALRERDIVLTCSPGANAASVAEYVLGAILTVYRRFGSVASQAAAGLWDREAATGREAYGKVLGIIGLGDIGARVAVRAKAFGMTLLATDPHLHPASFAVQEHGVTLVPLEALLERSDVVTLHPPLTPGTRHLISTCATRNRRRPTILCVVCPTSCSRPTWRASPTRRWNEAPARWPATSSARWPAGGRPAPSPCSVRRRARAGTP
ncbi:MAG: NAD(P)-dependent oxidoreductase [Deinococcales bacterium]